MTILTVTSILVATDAETVHQTMARISLPELSYDSIPLQRPTLGITENHQRQCATEMVEFRCS
jgi:hypothetical protein